MVSMSPDGPSRYRFGHFELDAGAWTLRRQGKTVRLERRPMQLLMLLLERRGQLVARSEIVERLWGSDVFVDVDAGVNTAVRKVRQALGDSSESPTFLETVPGVGYRFIAGVDSGERTAEAPAHLDVAQLPAELPPAASREGAAAPPGRWPWRRVWLALGAGAAAALFVLARVWGGGDTPPPAVVKLAVLPFESLASQDDTEYLADGLAEDTIAMLGRVDPERLQVVARTSTLAYKRTTKSIAEIGRELGVDYLVESSIRAESGQVRVTAKLIRVRDQVQVWSASFDQEPTSLLALQQDLSTAIVAQVHGRLAPDRVASLTRRQTRDPDAYDLYLRARNFEDQRTPATTRRAIEYYERAIAVDPGYALAWAGISVTTAASLLNSDTRPADVVPRARHAAAQAVAAGPDLSEAQFSAAYLQWCCDWDWPAAEAGFRRAMALDPQFVRARLVLGHALSQAGRHDEAGNLMRSARTADPLNALTHALSSQVAFQARDYRAALDHASRALALDATFWIGHMMLGQAAEALGDLEGASEALATAARLSGQNSKPIALRGYVLARAGRLDDARHVLEALEAAALGKYVPPAALALVHLGLEQYDQALDLLERSYEERDPHLIFLTVDPKWDPLRRRARFEALLARCGFPTSAAGIDPGP